MFVLLAYFIFEMKFPTSKNDTKQLLLTHGIQQEPDRKVKRDDQRLEFPSRIDAQLLLVLARLRGHSMHWSRAPKWTLNLTLCEWFVMNTKMAKKTFVTD